MGEKARSERVPCMEDIAGSCLSMYAWRRARLDGGTEERKAGSTAWEMGEVSMGPMPLSAGSREDMGGERKRDYGVQSEQRG